jgi:hypothetical protein
MASGFAASIAETSMSRIGASGISHTVRSRCLGEVSLSDRETPLFEDEVRGMVMPTGFGGTRNGE